MLKLMARGFFSVLVAMSLLFVAAGPSMASDNPMGHSTTPIISNTMDCPACMPVSHRAGSSVCVQLPCLNLTEAAEIISPTMVYGAVHIVQLEQLPEGLDFKPPTPPV